MTHGGEQPESSGEEYYPSKELCDALDGKASRAVNRSFWECVARGDFNSETLEWLKAVAQRIVDADTENTRQERQSAVFKATGLSGVDGDQSILRDLVATLHSFKFERKQIIDYFETPPAERQSKHAVWLAITDQDLEKLLAPYRRKGSLPELVDNLLRPLRKSS